MPNKKLHNEVDQKFHCLNQNHKCFEREYPPGRDIQSADWDIKHEEQQGASD